MMTIVIETPRLIIRKPILDDLDAIHSAKMKVWPELQKWMSWASDAEANEDSTRRFIESYNGNPLCAFHKVSGEFIVSTGIDDKGPGEYATGYWVAPDFLGQGYATESTNAILRYAFNALNAKAVHISYFEGNEKSGNIIRKLGFVENGIKPKAYKQFSSGEYLDEHAFVRHNADHLPALEVTWA